MKQATHARRAQRMTRMMGLGLGAWIAALVVPAIVPAVAQAQVVIYRCTDANGALTIQNDTPCPKGSKQERRVMEAAPAAIAAPFPTPSVAPATPVAPVVPVRPSGRVAPPAPQPPAPPAEPEIADADRLPPPNLYECRTYDDDRYLSDIGNPPPRCVSLTTTGLGGTIESGAGAACEMKTDRCQRIPDGALCASWRKRLQEAESALRFGVSENRAQAQAEVQRIARITRESTCGRSGP